ncbi:MAG: hypothetical protein IPH43_06540 [Xanthomonadales bacterium]|nr:hypothetical protein [Xanthomonadales bacterium]
MEIQPPVQDSGADNGLAVGDQQFGNRVAKRKQVRVINGPQAGRPFSTT